MKRNTWLIGVMMLASVAVFVVAQHSSASDSPKASPTRPSVNTVKTLGVGETTEYENQPGMYRLTLKSVALADGWTDVKFLVEGNGGDAADLNKEYALKSDGERIDDIAIATADDIADVGTGQHKVVTLAYNLPKGFEGKIVFVAFDGAREYDSFAIEAK